VDVLPEADAGDLLSVDETWPCDLWEAAVPEVLLPAAVELPVLRDVPLSCPTEDVELPDRELTELLLRVSLLRPD
jgi:hypothetical protein